MDSANRRFVGRRHELDRLLALVDQVDRSGQAVLLFGDPGIGKTALVNEVATHASARGFTVAAIRGSEGESTVPYAGLHLMLQPYLSDIDNLAEPQREALQIVFGLRQGEQPPSLLIGLATLSLLSDVAARSPLLVVAEDVHWLDEATRVALWFLCRRITWEPIVVTMTARTSQFFPPEDPLIERMTLPPLTFLESNQLLDQRAKPLTASQKRLVLEAAAGNPLALVELPPPHAGPSSEDRLTTRLEEAFADRFKTLDRAARIATVTVALNDRPSMAEALTATAHAVTQAPDPGWIRRAAAIGLLVVDHDEVVFRHPLARSAVLQATELDDREAGARALVATLDTSRTAWLRAGLATAPDEQISAELELLGDQRAAAGDQAGAVSAYRRAAELSAEPVSHAHRVLIAAETAERGGDYGQAATLLARLDNLGPLDDTTNARAAWLTELLPTAGKVRLGGPLTPALRAVEGMRVAGDTDRALAALQFLATLAWGSSPDDTAGREITDAADAFGLREDDPRLLVTRALATPLAAGTLALPSLPHQAVDDLDPEISWMWGYTLTTVGWAEAAHPYLLRSLTVLRARGQLQRLPHLQLAYAWNCYVRGDLREGRSAAEEAATIALDTQDPIGVAAGRALVSFFRGLDGASPDVAWITNGSEIAAMAIQTPAIRTTLTFADGMAALTRGDNDEAFRHLSRILDPGDPCYHAVFAAIAIPDVADAAVRAGRPDGARAAIAQAVGGDSQRWDSPILGSSLRAADRLLRPDLEVSADPGGDADGIVGTFTRGKVDLAIGSRLRRGRRPRESRAYLRSALDQFEVSHASAWVARAQAELQAAGEPTPNVADPAFGQGLTAQELKVAQLAATGLSNRAIAQSLYLSHRTVGAHLYAAYRKLNITGRTELEGALR